MSVHSHVSVRVPATCANLGPGFDCLGLALTLYTSYRVAFSPAAAPTDPILSIELRCVAEHAQPALALPADRRNLFCAALSARLAQLGMPPLDLRVRATFGAPPERGLGSSAAAVVAGLLAAEAITQRMHPRPILVSARPTSPAASVAPPRPAGRGGWGVRTSLLDAAVALEHGQHPDNVAAALLGGLVATARDERAGGWRAARVPCPDDLRAVLLVPDFAMDTAQGRALLPPSYSRADAVHNAGHAALLVAALATGDREAVAAAMDDRFHEPYRTPLFPQLPDLRAAAYEAGALGVCLSGGGSSVLALAADDRAQDVAGGLREAARALAVPGCVLIAGIDRRGAMVTDDADEEVPVPQPGEPGLAPTLAGQRGAVGAAGEAGLAATDAEPGGASTSIRRGAWRAPTAETGRGGDGTTLFCPDCGSRHSIQHTEYRCACGRPLEVALHDPALLRDGAAARRRLFDARLGALAAEDRSGVWRFRELLLAPPLSQVAPVTRPEGQTNCYFVGRNSDSPGHRTIGELAGLDWLWVKHEGENPTGSFKDRGMTLGVSVARWLGAEAVACASTGNTAASMAAYAAQAGLRALVLLPEGKVAAGKLSQALAYGAEVRQIAGDFDRAMVEVERLCRDEGIYLLNSLNPFRILGQQSLAFELAQQLRWDAPDWIALPAGNLGNTSALGMGLLRAHLLGLIARLPRIAAIQAAGANPFYQSYREGFAALRPVQAQTLATAINIGHPVSFPRAREVIRATRGVVAEVTDDEIMRAKAVVDRAGIGCEPASAASIAGLRQLVAAGTIQPHERVVAILTGNLLKDPDAVLHTQRVAAASGEEAQPC
ncbi:MAG TPA: threonine synthase [Ktedonobacterales bacterium]